MYALSTDKVLSSDNRRRLAVIKYRRGESYFATPHRVRTISGNILRRYVRWMRARINTNKNRFFFSFYAHDGVLLLAQASDHNVAGERNRERDKIDQDTGNIEITISRWLRRKIGPIFLPDNDSLLFGCIRPCFKYSRCWYFVLHSDPTRLRDVFGYWVNEQTC